MLKVIGSMQRGYEMQVRSYTPNGDLLGLDVRPSGRPFSSRVYWFAGADFPHSYLKVGLEASTGLVTSISLLKADVTVAYSSAADTCSVRIPGVPFFDLSGWPFEGTERRPDVREYTPIGIAVGERSIQVSLLEASDPEMVFVNGEVVIAVDRLWQVSTITISGLTKEQVGVASAAVRG